MNLFTAFSSYFVNSLAQIFRSTNFLIHLLAAESIFCFILRFIQIVSLNTLINIFSFLDFFHNILTFIKSISVINIISDWDSSNCLVCIEIWNFVWLSLKLAI
jgi:hypothetical protein